MAAVPLRSAPASSARREGVVGGRTGSTPHQHDGGDVESRARVGVIAQGLELAGSDGEGRGFPKTVRLAEEFYEHLQQHAVPLDERALAHLAGNSLGLDLYALLAHRLPRLARPLRLSWAQLHTQLGAGDRAAFSLAQRIREILPSVGAVYPDAEVEIERGGLLLKPSRPAVPAPTRVPGLRLVG